MSECDNRDDRSAQVAAMVARVRQIQRTVGKDDEEIAHACSRAALVLSELATRLAPPKPGDGMEGYS